MSIPVGAWRINANGFKGGLTINADSAGHLSGTINIDAGFIDELQGVWSEAAQQIVFNRIRRGPNGAIDWIQTYTGYLYLTKEPIFVEGSGGSPEPNPNTRLLTGSFEALGIGASPGRPRFGWVARQDNL
jgi:hypothetical protein